MSAGRTLGQMTPEERAAVIGRAAIRLQEELRANAPAISQIMDSVGCPIYSHAHVPHGTCPGSAPELPSEPLLDLRQVATRLAERGHRYTGTECWHPDCGGIDSNVSGYQCMNCGHYFPRSRVQLMKDSEPYCRAGMGCQSVAAKLANRMRGHNLGDSAACRFGTCAEAREIWVGTDSWGRTVAHFQDRYVADRALSQRIVTAAGPLTRDDA